MKHLVRSALALVMAAGVLALALAPARAQMSADQIWKKAEQRLQSLKSYTLSYDYNGPKGHYVFNYAVVRPDAVRTKILEGKHRGAALVYHPSSYGQCVKARLGFLGKTIMLDDPEVKNTPIIKPVYDMLMDSARGAAATLKGDDKVFGHTVYVLDLNASTGLNEVAVDKSSYDVLRWKYTDAEGPKERVFYNIKANVSPRIDF